MNQLIEYWYIIIALIVLLIFVSGIIFAFFKSPSETQLRKVKAWLLWAVTKAEAELGYGTGQLKLRFVYDLFISKFTWIAWLISFEMFSDLVDDALDEMRDMLKTNQAAFHLVSRDGDA
ncbi:hypothetical protein [Sporosarcina sp. FSL K6-5500]|uniref:hypothetical protein n=1 Tax=Sporosarcina sp. FSL K6-5500 TaxID=2921558 RepID=UPI0030F5C877